MSANAKGEPTMDATMNVALLYVAVTAVVAAGIALVTFGGRASLGVLLGGVIATLNLYVLARIGAAFLAGKGRSAPWAIVGALKLLALLGGVWLIFSSGFVSGFAFAIGYASLVVGIVLAGVFGPKPPDLPDPDTPKDDPKAEP